MLYSVYKRSRGGNELRPAKVRVTMIKRAQFVAPLHLAIEHWWLLKKALRDRWSDIKQYALIPQEV